MINHERYSFDSTDRFLISPMMVAIFTKAGIDNLQTVLEPLSRGEYLKAAFYAGPVSLSFIWAALGADLLVRGDNSLMARPIERDIRTVNPFDRPLARRVGSGVIRALQSVSESRRRVNTFFNNSADQLREGFRQTIITHNQSMPRYEDGDSILKQTQKLSIRLPYRGAEAVLFSAMFFAKGAMEIGADLTGGRKKSPKG